MNESGSAAGPARGELRLDLDHVIALHDEIDLPFGEVRSKLGGGVAGHHGLRSLNQGLGGGVAGHNGLRSLSQGLGGPDFWRVRGGVGRPNTTDPEIVSNYVLSRFREPDEEVRLLIQSAADEAERLLGEITGSNDDLADQS